jgi:hypothetical protein
MIERREQSCFALESSETFRLVRQRGGKRLDRDVTPESVVASLPHFAHSALADRGNDFVLAYVSAALEDQRHGRCYAARWTESNLTDPCVSGQT